MSLARRVGRDAVTWIALSLVIAFIVVVTTHQSAQAKTTPEPPTNPTTLDHTSVRTSTSTKSLGSSIRRQKTTEQNHAHADLVPATKRQDTQHQTTQIAPTGELTTGESTTGESTTGESTTTTVVPTAQVIATAGVLSYPSDVRTTYPIVVAAGPLEATLTWGEQQEFAVSLRCNGAALAQRSSLGLISFVAEPTTGNCQLSVSLVAAGPNTTNPNKPAAYSLVLHYLGPPAR
jgi:hypothetical protein